MTNANDPEKTLREQIEKITLFIQYLQRQQDRGKRTGYQWFMEYRKPCGIYFMIMIAFFLMLASIAEYQYDSHKISKEKYLVMMREIIPLLFIIMNIFYLGTFIVMEAAGHGAPTNNFILQNETFQWFKLLLREITKNNHLRNLPNELFEEPSSMLRTEEVCEMLQQAITSHRNAIERYQQNPARINLDAKNYDHLPFWEEITSPISAIVTEPSSSAPIQPPRSPSPINHGG